MRRVRDVFSNWDGETYICDYCAGNNDDDDITEVCQACEGPYPDCTTSCSMFDD